MQITKHKNFNHVRSKTEYYYLQFIFSKETNIINDDIKRIEKKNHEKK